MKSIVCTLILMVLIIYAAIALPRSFSKEELKRGDEYYAAGDYVTAAEHYDEATFWNWFCADGYLGIARCFLAQDYPEGALSTLERGDFLCNDKRIDALRAELTAPEVTLESLILAWLGRDAGAPTDAELASITSIWVNGSSEVLINSTASRGGARVEHGAFSSTDPKILLDEAEAAALLSRCPSLSELVLVNCGINDLAPFSALEAQGLMVLNLSCNSIADLTPLSGFTGLRTLYLSHNHIMSLAPLSELTGLLALGVGSNDVSDLAPLASLTSLMTLNISETDVADLTPLAGLTRLASLSAQDTKVSDWSAVEGVSSVNK